jgi:hypothetical protein
MEPGGDQGRPLRRASDKWTDERIDDAMQRIDRELVILAPLPNAVGKLEVRVDRAVADVAAIDITKALRRVESVVSALDEKIDAEMDALSTTFIPRAEMPVYYMPRSEAQQKREWYSQWPAIALASAQLVGLAVLLIRTAF